MDHSSPQHDAYSQWLSIRTFQQGEIAGVVISPIECHEDQRGWLIELFRSDETPAEQFPRMGYISETKPQVTRGPHVHLRQTDSFAFVGPGDFLISMWDLRGDSPTLGYNQRLVVGQSNRQLVVIPPGVVHAYKNVSDHAALSLNFPNQLYGGEGRKSAVDEIRFEQIPGHPFVLDET